MIPNATLEPLEPPAEAVSKIPKEFRVTPASGEAASEPPVKLCSTCKPQEPLESGTRLKIVPWESAPPDSAAVILGLIESKRADRSGAVPADECMQNGFTPGAAGVEHQRRVGVLAIGPVETVNHALGIRTVARGSVQLDVTRCRSAI